MPERIEPYPAAIVQIGTNAIAHEERVREDIDANAAKLVGWIRYLHEETPSAPRLIVFPVMPLVGASNNRPVASVRTSFNLNGPLDPALDSLIAACGKYNCYAALTLVVQDEDMPRGAIHSGIILGPDGIVLLQPKFMQHRASEIPHIREQVARYTEKYGEAAAHAVADTPIGRLSCIIEVEHWVPEMVRTRAASGADIIVHPNLELRDVDAPFVALKQTLAFQNGVYLLSVNCAYETWTEGDREIFRKGKGDSIFASPTGEILARCDQGGEKNGEAYAIATIDLEKVAAARERYSGELVPVWDLYANKYRAGNG